MKFELAIRFRRDWNRLPLEHQKQFKSLIPGFNAACEAFVTDQRAWPASLRVKPMAGHPGIWEMTWSFSGPDGRATFRFSHDGEQTWVTWRRIGGHEIYVQP